jgi:outer membrane autotransporter protein
MDTNTITLCAAGTAGSNNDIPLNVLFGEGVTGAQQTAFGASRLFGSAMMSQAAFWRDGAGDGQDLNGITPQNNRSMKDGPIEGWSEGIVTTGYQPRTWRMWTTGFGGRASLDGDAEKGTSDLQTRTAGFAVGLDYQIDRSTLFGIAGGYSYSGFSVDQRLTTGTVEGAHVGLYGVKRLGTFYLATTAEYARFINKTDRFIDWVLDERAWGSFKSEEFSARLEAGWRRSIRGLRVTPFAGVEVSYLRSDGFAEESARLSGGPGILGLTFGSKSVTSLTSSLGVQFDRRIPLSNGQILTPFARVAWVHEFNPDRSIDASLTSSPEASFSPDGAAAPDNLAKVNAGLKLDVTRSVGLYAYFDGEFSGHSQSYTGNGGVRISW